MMQSMRLRRAQTAHAVQQRIALHEAMFNAQLAHARLMMNPAMPWWNTVVLPLRMSLPPSQTARSRTARPRVANARLRRNADQRLQEQVVPVVSIPDKPDEALISTSSDRGEEYSGYYGDISEDSATSCRMPSRGRPTAHADAHDRGEEYVGFYDDVIDDHVGVVESSNAVAQCPGAIAAADIGVEDATQDTEAAAADIGGAEVAITDEVEVAADEAVDASIREDDAIVWSRVRAPPGLAAPSPSLQWLESGAAAKLLEDTV